MISIEKDNPPHCDLHLTESITSFPHNDTNSRLQEHFTMCKCRVAFAFARGRCMRSGFLRRANALHSPDGILWIFETVKGSTLLNGKPCLAFFRARLWSSDNGIIRALTVSDCCTSSLEAATVAFSPSSLFFAGIVWAAQWLEEVSKGQHSAGFTLAVGTPVWRYTLQLKTPGSLFSAFVSTTFPWRKQLTQRVWHLTFSEAWSSTSDSRLGSAPRQTSGSRGVA